MSQDADVSCHISRLVTKTTLMSSRSHQTTSVSYYWNPVFSRCQSVPNRPLLLDHFLTEPHVFEFAIVCLAAIGIRTYSRQIHHN